MLSAEEFRDSLHLRFGLIPGHLPDGCDQRFSEGHAMSRKTGGVVLPRHSDVKAEWHSICAQAVTDEPLIHAGSKTEYLDLYLVHRRHFTPLVFSVMECGARKREPPPSTLPVLAGKWKRSYADVCRYVRALTTSLPYGMLPRSTEPHIKSHSCRSVQAYAYSNPLRN